MKKDNPFVYIHFIEEHMRAYSILKSKSKYPVPIDLFFIKGYLLGKMIELILKTELILKGYSSQDLKKSEIGGHNLIKLFNLLGYPKDDLVDETTYDAIKHLNIYYVNNKYEYPQYEDVEIKNIMFLENYITRSILKLKNHLKNNKLSIKIK